MVLVGEHIQKTQEFLWICLMLFFSTKDAIGYENDIPRNFNISAHEIGHILLNEGHYGDRGIVTEDGNKKEINLMRVAGNKDNTVSSTKRLEKVQCAEAYNFFSRNYEPYNGFKMELSEGNK